MSQCALSSGIDPSAITDAGMVLSAINAGIVTIQFTLPLFIGIVLAGVIRNASTASTWSVISTILHDSRLHRLFSSDSVPRRHISPRVLFFSYLGLLSLYLTTISSVITPLGLKEGLVDRIDSRPSFEFAFNNDTFILGTAERKSYELMRVCGFRANDTCPGQEDETVEVDKNSFISGTPGPLGQDNEGGESLVPTAKTRKPSKTSSAGTGKGKTSSPGTSVSSSISATPSPPGQDNEGGESSVPTANEDPTVEVDESSPISATPSPPGQDNEGGESLVPTVKTRKPSKTSSPGTSVSSSISATPSPPGQDNEGGESSVPTANEDPTVEVDESSPISATPSPPGQDNEGGESLVPTVKTRKPSKTSSPGTSKSSSISATPSPPGQDNEGGESLVPTAKTRKPGKTSSGGTGKGKTSSAGTGKGKGTGTGATGGAGTGTGVTGGAGTSTMSTTGTSTGTTSSTSIHSIPGNIVPQMSTITVYSTVTVYTAAISPPPASLDKGPSGDQAPGLPYPTGFGPHAAAEYAIIVGNDAIAKLMAAASSAVVSDYAAAASVAVAAGSAASSGYVIAASVATATSSYSSTPRLARRQEDTEKYRVGSKVPEWLTNVFADVSYYGASVASVFDIEFRNFIINQRPDKTLYTIGQFRFLETLILKWGYKLIDGLVVDMRHGGVGFRKHALPLRARNKHGAGWDETLLWMTPETVCEANIVSLEVTKDTEGVTKVGLVDMGGFGWKGWERKPRAVDTSQPPNVTERAWSGAYYFNEAVAAAVVGKAGMESHYSNTTTTTAANETAPMFYPINETDHGWVKKLWDAGDSLAGKPLAVHRMPLGAKIRNGMQAGQTGVDVKCTGLTPSTRSGAPLVTCGLIIGAANKYTAPPGSDSQSYTYPGTFRYPLYTCATAFRASLQKTTFSSKPSTRNLASITMHNTTLIPKPPLWGVEFYPTLNLTTTEISPLWGPLHPDHKRVANMTVSEGNFLYLPAGQSADEIVDSLSGTSAYQYAANLIYSDDSRLTPGYSGDINYALYMQWQSVTVNATSAADLPGLVWTDVFANLVTSVSMGGRGVDDVRVSRRELRYDMRYAAPALMLLCLWGGMFAAAVVFWVGRRVRMKQLRQLLNQVSTGRVVMNMLQQSKEGTLSADRWAKGQGRTVVGLECRRSDGAERWGKVKEGDEKEGDEKELEEMVGTVVAFVEEPEDGIVMDMLKSVR